MASRLEDAEQRAIEQFFQELAEPVRLQTYCLKGKAKGKAIKEKRILVLTPYRLYLFGQGKKVGKLKLDVHLYDVLEFVEEDEGVIRVRTRDARQKDNTVFLSLKQVPDVIAAVGRAAQLISHDFPVERRLVCSEPLPQTEVTGAARGYIDVYKSFCNYHRTQPNVEFLHYLNSIIAAGSVDLDLSSEEPSCGVVDWRTEISLDLVPVFAALRYNHYFRSIKLRNVMRKEVVSLAADVLSRNKTITRVTFQNTGSDERQFGELGNALMRNADHALQVVELVDCKLGSTGAHSIQRALSHWRHALKVLNLSNCKLQPKAVEGLFASFEQEFGMSLAIEDLDLSGNHFGEQGTRALDHWLNIVKSTAVLSRLALASCALSVGLLNSLKSFVRLTSIDLSGNKIADEDGGYSRVADVCECTYTLQKLRLAGCDLRHETLEPVMEAIVNNIKIGRIDLDLADNAALGPAGAAYLATVVARSKSITSLDVSGLKLKEKPFVDFLDKIAANRVLSKLAIRNILNKNAETKPSKELMPIVVALSILINTTSLVSLDVSQGFGRNVIYPLLEAISRNTKLRSLSIRDNLLGDKGAEAISSLLRTNTSLTALDFDDNKLSFSGFQVVLSALRVNQSVYKVPWPINDIMLVQRTLADSADRSAQFCRVQVALYNRLVANRPTNAQEEPTEHPTPLTVAPMLDVPDHIRLNSQRMAFDESQPEIVPPTGPVGSGDRLTVPPAGLVLAEDGDSSDDGAAAPSPRKGLRGSEADSPRGSPMVPAPAAVSRSRSGSSSAQWDANFDETPPPESALAPPESTVIPPPPPLAFDAAANWAAFDDAEALPPPPE